MRPAKRECKLITFQGINYRRYPGDLYYRPNGTGKKLGKGNLHQEIWKFHYGPIPEGMEIHHKDANTDNNDISNFECLTPEEHNKRHPSREMTPAFLAHLESIRPMTAEWHKSDAGKQWHSKHSLKTWENRKMYAKKCEDCGKEYETPFPSRSRFCSEVCKSHFRRVSGADNETRECLVCGMRFTVNKYERKNFCNRKCMSVQAQRTMKSK